jgi:hypothetical protein
MLMAAARIRQRQALLKAQDVPSLARRRERL